jgi:hypothetical protein
MTPWTFFPAPWTFDVKFSYSTQFIFGSLMSVAGKDGNFKMLPLGSAPRPDTWTRFMFFSHLIYIRRCLLRSESLCSAIHPHQACSGIPVVTSILQPSAGASSSSLSAASPDQDSADDYPEIRGGGVPVRTPLRRATLSSWWPWSEDLRTTAPTDIPPSGD